jgi:hypothetical protein
MHLTENDKEKIRKEISKHTRNDVIFGQFEQFPPYGEWFVTLYFEGNFAFENRYNTEIGYDFLISQVVSGISENEIMVSVKIVENDN